MTTATPHSSAASTEEQHTNSGFRVAVASFVGTAVEFYDFYIYGLAAALVLGELFFPTKDTAQAIMASFLTFGIAFVARPIGAAMFGHFGDKVGRKTTLIASLLIMGISTTLIGFLPTYHQAGIVAPLLLCVLRFGQGLGLGGEWGGAALLATENAPKGKRAIFAMFPQMGPPIGFIVASGIFITLNSLLTPEQMMSYGWRIPFILSIILIGLGLYVRMSIVESAAFQKMVKKQTQSRAPLADIVKKHYKELILGSLSAMSCFTLFFLTTVFSLQYATTLHPWQSAPYYPKIDYLFMLMIAIVFMALGSPLGAWLSEKLGRRPTFLITGSITIIMGYFWGDLMNTSNVVVSFTFLAVALFVMGALWTPLAAFLPEIFPTNVRYSGASMSFSFGGILGGSLTPFAAAWMTTHFGEQGINLVGWFLIASCLISMIAVWLLPETRHIEIDN
ncbi:MFS transporter [Snodgrassella sp. CFCC 13594]|uniref:MFS transporter n=1 Tax=Snodgrassella sp. CFCC 13594 TaxID=1775559 RepID=UPI00082A70DE|nr:MFS transporter [Snodgrassella sp. CFCC 13594]